MDVLALEFCDCLDGDQRVGEMSSCRERRVEYRATGVPSARVVGLSGSFPEPERSSAPEKVCTRHREWCRRLVLM
jgi:hypothetical protein